MNRERITGKLEKNKAGFGFVKQEDGPDIFIGRNNMAGAMHGDTVSAVLLPSYFRGKNREGVIEGVIERNTAEIIGTLHESRRFGFVISDDKRNTDDVFVKKQDFHGARGGDKVVVKITRYPKKHQSAEGKITEVISRKGEKGTEIRVLIRANGLFENFPKKVDEEAAEKSLEAIDKGVLKGRRDLRGKKIITIDSASAKDLDDGVSLEKLANGSFLLGVHIADVSHYVKMDGPLDREALKRGNSVYLMNHVVPMLPKALSNGICSLAEGKDRLTLSCEMEIDERGRIMRHDIFESVIRSRARMVYSDVSDMIENEDKELTEKYGDIYDELKNMGKVACLLRENRKEEGSLDFDFDQAEIDLDENEVPLHIGVQERRTADRIIEEFMLAANRTVAEHFFRLGCPFIYRVHEKPDTEKIMELQAFLRGFGIDLKGDPENLRPKDLNRVLEEVKGRPYENIISTVMLRAMKKACYSTACDGHFGLSFKYYCHFTSPIRRYPDLMIHRIIKANMHRTSAKDMAGKFKAKAEAAALISSQTEKKAQEIEREAEKMKKAQYMEKHVGEVFDGIISGMNDFGIYAELPNTVEGMVRLDSLKDDFYEYEESKYRMVGRNTGKIYALGDSVRVKCIGASADDRQIDFVFVK